MQEFVTPSFLQNRSVDDVYEKIKGILPPDIDLSEGGHGWNMTRPIAIIASEIYEFILPEVIRLIFPDWSYGEFLDGQAKARGLKRRGASAAAGEITITGAADTVIPAGSLFSTAAIHNEPSVDYETLEDAVIPNTGSKVVPIQCVQAGIVGNTTANTIVLVSSKLTGITSVTNEKDIAGGTEQENDESLFSRIDEYDKNLDNSFIGNVADYKRWAKSVEGVGDATVIPAEDDSALVTIILTDSKGAPATETLRAKVYNYIMKPDAPESRLAPCGAVLDVIAPATMSLSIKATVELAEGASIESVKSGFSSQLTSYLAEALDEEEIKYTRISAVLSKVDGVADFKDLQFGIVTESGTTYGTSNIPISDRQLPTVESKNLLLTAGTV